MVLPASTNRIVQLVCDSTQVPMDASTVGKQPTELVWLYSPDCQVGGWAPPLAWSLDDSACQSVFAQLVDP